jgi:choline-sulfatase
MDDMIGQILDELEANGFADNTLIIYTSDHGESLGEHGLFFKHSPARAAVGVPLVLAGAGVRQRGSVDTPVSLVDLYPTILDAYGLEAEEDRCGSSLLRILDDGAEGARAREAKQEQGVFAEWHGPGFRGAWYMLERLPYKFVWYESFPPTLHDIVNDPTEDHNLADDPDYVEILTDFERELRSRLDPEAVSLQAKRDLGLIGTDGTDLTKEPPRQ